MSNQEKIPDSVQSPDSVPAQEAQKPVDWAEFKSEGDWTIAPKSEPLNAVADLGPAIEEAKRMVVAAEEEKAPVLEALPEEDVTKEFVFDPLQNYQETKSSYEDAAEAADKKVNLLKVAVKRMLEKPAEDDMKVAARGVLMNQFEDAVRRAVLAHESLAKYLRSINDLPPEKRILVRDGKSEVLSLDAEIKAADYFIGELGKLRTWAEEIEKDGRYLGVKPKEEASATQRPPAEAEKASTQAPSRFKKAIGRFAGLLRGLFTRAPGIVENPEIPAPEPQIRYESQSAIRKETAEVPLPERKRQYQQRLSQYLNNPTLDNLDAAQDLLVKMDTAAAASGNSVDLYEGFVFGGKQLNEQQIQDEINYQSAATFNTELNNGLNSFKLENGYEGLKAVIGPLVARERIGSRKDVGEVKKFKANVLKQTLLDESIDIAKRKLLLKLVQASGFEVKLPEAARTEQKFE